MTEDRAREIAYSRLEESRETNDFFKDGGSLMAVNLHSGAMRDHTSVDFEVQGKSVTLKIFDDCYSKWFFE